MTALIEVHYLPSLEYFCSLMSFAHVKLEAHEHFIKQTYRNRCYIRGANNIQMLNIPVEKGRSKTPIRDLKTDNRQSWRKHHWRSLKSAYGNAPFFEFFEPHLQQHFKKEVVFLVDFTYPLLTLCLDWLGISTTLSWTDMYENQPDRDVLDLRSVINAKSDYSERSFYTPVPYPQVFGKNFAPNLSIVDLLSCEGPNAVSILKRSAVV
ncbi:MAG: WbqC family protein [Cyclobacteriaceae bacterium]